MPPTSDSKLANWISAIQLIAAVLVPFITLAMGWIGSNVTDNKAAIAGIHSYIEYAKENSYTHKDAAEEQLHAQKNINELKEVMHRIDKNITPREDVNRLKDEISELRKAIVKGGKP